MKSFEHKDKYKQEDWTNFEKISKKKKNCKIYHINHSENLPTTNYCLGVILKAMKNSCD